MCLQDTYADDLLAAVFQGVLADTGLSASEVGDICVGKYSSSIKLRGLEHMCR